MTLATLDDLVSTVARTLRRTDLAADILIWVALGEAQINRRLRTRRMIGRAQAEITAEYAALPDRFAGVATFDMETGDTLSSLSAETLAERALRSTTLGTPRHYAVVGDTFRFWPSPDRTYTAELTFYTRLPALTTTNPTNWLLQDHPDVYLYGTLLQSAPFLKADERVAVWSGLFLTALEDVKASDADDRRAGRSAPLRASVPVPGVYRRSNIFTGEA